MYWWKKTAVCNYWIVERAQEAKLCLYVMQLSAPSECRLQIIAFFQPWEDTLVHAGRPWLCVPAVSIWLTYHSM